MTTTVRFHTDTAAAIEAWERTLTADPRGGPELRHVLLTELIQRLEAAEGLPQDRLTDFRTEPPTHYVQLDGRTWVQYVIRESRAALFGRARQVIVIGFGRPPADPTGRSSGPG